jgi:hypothetical protein
MSLTGDIEAFVSGLLAEAGLETYKVSCVREQNYSFPVPVYVEPLDEPEDATSGFSGEWTIYVGREAKKGDLPYLAIRAFLEIMLYDLRREHCELVAPQSREALELAWDDAIERIVQSWVESGKWERT